MTGRTIGGRYRLEGRLGAGGEAEVFRARDEQTGRPVALRLCRATAVAPVESHDLPALNPRWVWFQGSGLEPDGTPFQVFDLIEGETLEQRLREGPLEPGAWRVFAVDSLAAVAALHDILWPHGDLNGGSFMREAATGRWRLLELPFLRRPRREDLQPYFGRIETMAPERLNGAAPTFASDLYALGCLFFEAAAGRQPHPGGTSAAVAINRLCFEAPSLAPLAPGLSAREVAGVMRLLARAPAERFPTAGAAAHHLLSEA